MKRQGEYSCIIIHQFDPENPAPGGIDTCIRDMLLHAPAGERILLLGVSRTRPLLRRTRIDLFAVPVDFVPLSRADPSNQRRRIPHSLRLLFPLLLTLLTVSTRKSTVHVHRLEPALITRWFPARKRVYFVHTNTESAIAEHGDSFWRKAPHVYRRLERSALKASDLILVFNRETAEKYHAQGFRARRMRTWFNEKIYFPLDTPSGDPTTKILWVGRLEPPKDPLLAIEVFKSLKEAEGASDTHWECTIIGDGTMRREVDERIAELGLSEEVRMLGAQPREAVGQHMRETGVFLMTSHFEGSPIVMYEALASGVPVVASQESDPDGVLDQRINGRIVSGRNPADFVGAALAVLQLARPPIAASVQDRGATLSLAELWKSTSGEE